MAYHGYIPFISKYGNTIYQKNKSLKILEIGLLSGVSLFSIVNNLNALGVKNYSYTGVDIRLLEEIQIFNHYTFKTENSNINLVEENSIDFLESCNEIYDIILIDGDHNYPTVKKECACLNKISHSDTLFIFDDYHGKWSERDLFYREKEGWENVNSFTELSPDKEKKGVKAAVDEFISMEKLNSFVLMGGEPICLITKENSIIVDKEN